MLRFWRVAPALVLLIACSSSPEPSPTIPALSSGSSSSTPIALVVSPEAIGPLRVGMAEADALATGLLAPPALACEGIGNFRTSDLHDPYRGGAMFERGVLATIWVNGPGATLPSGEQVVGLTLDELGQALGSQFTVEVDEQPGPFRGSLFSVHLPSADSIYAGSIDPPTRRIVTFGVPFVPICD